MAACLERKLTLSGRVQEFSCELLRFDRSFGVLKYIIDRAYDVAGTRLLPGDVTFALYWSDRPYTLYVWLTRGGSFSYYFNIADSITLSPGLFSWRDLAVDILVDRSGVVRVLDEDEVPLDLPSDLILFIRRARDLVLENWPQIVREANAVIEPLLAEDRQP